MGIKHIYIQIFFLSQMPLFHTDYMDLLFQFGPKESLPRLLFHHRWFFFCFWVLRESVILEYDSYWPRVRVLFFFHLPNVTNPKDFYFISPHAHKRVQVPNWMKLDWVSTCSMMTSAGSDGCAGKPPAGKPSLTLAATSSSCEWWSSSISIWTSAHSSSVDWPSNRSYGSWERKQGGKNWSSYVDANVWFGMIDGRFIEQLFW